MEQENLQTEYDSYIQTREVQMLKAMLPFVNPTGQMPLAMVIQFMELKHVAQTFQNNPNRLTALSIGNEGDRRSLMLQTLKRFCTPKERETIDNILNIMCVMDTVEDPIGRYFT